MRESRFWALSMLAAVVMLVVLTAHMAVMHLSPLVGVSLETTRSFAAVLDRARSGVQTWGYYLLLAAALYHGLYGLRGVILELPVGRAGARAVTVILALVGLIAFGYGAYVVAETARLAASGI